METILEVQQLHVRFRLRGKTLHALRGIDLKVYQGESLAIVGESGCGKSVLNKSLIGLIDQNGFVDGGSILYYGLNEKNADGSRKPIDLTKIKRNKDWLSIRGREICMVPQDPMTSLNPLKTIGWQIEESLRLHRGLRGAAAHAEVIRLLNDVRMDDPERRSRQYPHELSGGMRQRVVIAIAMACQPKILICDEPTTALDVTIQAEILQLLHELKAKYHLTILFITHDLGVVANIAERVAVMYAGDVVEVGTVNELFFDARHPYTWALLSSLPQLGIRGEDLYTIHGTPPSLYAELTGDAFAARNPQSLVIDHLQQPPYFDISETHRARTWLLDPRAPKIDPPPAMQLLKQIGGNTNDEC